MCGSPGRFMEDKVHELFTDSNLPSAIEAGDVEIEPRAGGKLRRLEWARIPVVVRRNPSLDAGLSLSISAGLPHADGRGFGLAAAFSVKEN